MFAPNVRLLYYSLILCFIMLLARMLRHYALLTWVTGANNTFEQELKNTFNMKRFILRNRENVS